MAETKQAEVKPAEEKAAKRGTLDLEQFPTQEAAIAAVKDRVKGHRRVFTVTHGGNTRHMVASHPAYVGQYMFQQLGGTIEEAGKPSRAATARPVGVTAIVEAVSHMDEKQKSDILEQLKKLLEGGKKK